MTMREIQRLGDEGATGGADPSIQRESRVLWSLLPILLLAVIMFKAAWLGDDAFITFRTVDNFLHGYGLTWNTNDHVQAFTHPLWMFLVAGVHWCTGELLVTVAILSIALSLAAVFLLAAGARNRLAAFAAIAVLASSKAFIDYTSSGLETPLTYLLIAFLYAVLFREPQGRHRVLLLALAAGLLGLNRLDLIAFALFPLALAVYRARKGGSRAVVLGTQLLAGLSPLALWLGFSLFYYGSMLPNTAYAKLATGVPRGLLWEQGLHYLFDSISEDAVTLSAMALAIVLSAVRRDAREFCVSAGVILYVIYVVSVGADFMSGRFLAPPAFAAAFLLSRSELNPAALTAAAVAFGTLGLTSPNPACLYSIDDKSRGVGPSGIADERAFYYAATGLLRHRRGQTEPDHEWARWGKEARE